MQTKRVDDLAQKLEQSEKAREKAESDAALSRVFERDFKTQKML
jgi:hypothetical protein